MPKAALGLYFAQDRITAVRLKGGMKGASVAWIKTIAAKPEERLAALRTLNIAHQAPVSTSFGACEIFERVVELPFTDRARVTLAAPLEAEESLPLPLEKLYTHARILEKTPDGSRVSVTAINNDTLDKRLELIEAADGFVKSAGTDPSVLAFLAGISLPDPSGTLVVDLDGDRCQCVFIGKNGPEKSAALSSSGDSPSLPGEISSLIRLGERDFPEVKAVYLTGPGALNADRDLFSSELGARAEIIPYPQKAVGKPPSGAPQWPIYATAMGIALMESLGGGARQVDFLQSRTDSEGRGGNLKNQIIAVSIAAAILVAMWAGAEALVYSNKKRELDSISGQVRKLFTTAMPNVKNIVDEVAQLKSHINEQEEKARTLGSLLYRETSPLGVLRELSARIPPDIKVEFRDFAAEQERVRIEGETTNFDAIDKIQAKLQEYPWFSSVAVSDAKASVDQTKVIFKLTITLAKEEPAK